MASVPLPPLPGTLPSSIIQAGARITRPAGYRVRRLRLQRIRTSKPGVLRPKRQEVLETEQPGVLYGHPKGEAHLWVWL